MTAGATELPHRGAVVMSRENAPLDRVAEMPESPRGERFARERLALPPQLQTGRHVRQRPVLHRELVMARVALQGRLRRHAAGIGLPAAVEYRDAVNGHGHLAADERRER